MVGQLSFFEMSEKAPSISSLKPVRERFSKTNLKKYKKMLILSAKTPSAIISSAILCRAALRSNVLFHVKYMDSITSMKGIRKTIGTKSDALALIVGINTYGKAPSGKDSILNIGSDFHSELSSIDETEFDFPTAAIALALNQEKMTARADDLTLAAVGSILEAPSHKITTKLLKTCEKSGLLSPKKGFKIPGSNFIPLDELFLNNIHPYLDGLSGVPGRCQKLISDADIPIKKRREPLSHLTNEEATQLTTVLIPRLSQAMIQSVLGGGDYELLHEKPDSPLRYITSIRALSYTAWSQNKMGLLLGVLIGDRARLLDNLVDSYREHSRKTVEGIQKLSEVLNETETHVQTGNEYISAPIDIPDEVLPDVGRITLESEIGIDNKFLILRTKQSITVSWAQEISSLRVIADMLGRNIPASPNSNFSCKITESSDQTHAKILETIRAIVEGV